jgi:hypothetical protein
LIFSLIKMAKKRTRGIRVQPERLCKRVANSQGQDRRPEVVEPGAASPEVTVQEAVAPEAVEPEVVESEAVESEVVESEVVESEVVESEAVEPEVVESEVVAPDIATPDAATPESTTSVSNKPQSFSKKPVDVVGNLLNIKPFNYKELDVFEFKKYRIPAKDLDDLEENLRRSRRRFPDGVWDETNTRRIVDDIMYMAADVLSKKTGKKIVVQSERDIVGEECHGDADMAVMFGSAILLVMEAKATDLNEGVAQNILQIQAAHQHNVRNGINTRNTMFGLATIASKSILLRVVFDDEGGMEVTRSDPITLPIRYPEPHYTLRMQLGLLLGHITWSMDQTAKLLRSAH